MLSLIKELSESGLNAASGLALVRASNYALNTTNTLGGKGFLVPLRSSTYRALLADSTELAEAASGDWIGLLDYNLGKQIYNEIANPGSVSVSIGQVIATTESYKHKESRPQAGWQYKSPVGLPMAFHEKNSHQQ